AIDTTDTTKPKVIATWSLPLPATSHHGLSISDDGNRGYFTSLGNSLSRGAPPDLIINPDAPATNGMFIYDVSDIQVRRTSPQVKLIGSVLWKDGSTAQHTINIKIKGKPYVVFVDEGGSPNARPLGCPDGFALYPMARIIDIGDETKPKVVSKLM